MKEPEAQPAGLYVHVPFCRTKCPYCDFYSVPHTNLSSEWLRALEREAVLYKERFPVFDTLYLGGGTPTVLSEKEFARVMEILHGHFVFDRDTEVTLEANPDDVTAEKIRTYKGLGINRISLGVQSMDERELAFLGRRHTARRAGEAMERIQTSGAFDFGIDLIYGLPGQTVAGWSQTLRKVLVFSPHHISCYQLTVSGGTPLWKMQQAGSVEPLDDERARDLFLATSSYLEGQGFEHYEVSNYARRGKSRSHVCRHNLKYWKRAPYLGLGPSAHSFQGNRRWWNRRSVIRYCRDLEQGRKPVQGSERLSEEQVSLERLSLQLRTRAGTPISELRGYQECDRALPGLLEAGYLELIDGRAVPTREGYLVADRLPLLFL